MSRVMHFEIHASDPERVIGFYHELFGWTFTSWDGPMEYWLISTGPADQPGMGGGLMRRQGPVAADGQPVNAFVCTVDVPNIDQAMEKLIALGGTIVVPKMAVPSIGWLVYFKDPDGNILGAMQVDPAAA